MAAIRTPPDQAAASVEASPDSTRVLERPTAPVAPARQPATGRGRRPVEIPYINRELSWLEFNERVLHEAIDERNPLLERARFLAIFASNLDEFFQVRVAGLKQQLAAGRSNPTPDGMGAAETLDAVRTRLLPMVARHSADVRRSCARSLPRKASASCSYDERAERHVELRRRFFDEIFPVLTPLAVDPGHPFPYISDLSLSLAVTVRDPESGERLFARIKVPPILPRLMEVGQRTYVLLEQVIAANLDALFPGMEIVEHHLFRVTRNADLSIEEEEAPDLLMAIEEELRKRRFGKVVRLEIERTMPHQTRPLLMQRPGRGCRGRLRDLGHARPDRAQRDRRARHPVTALRAVAAGHAGPPRARRPRRGGRRLRRHPRRRHPGPPPVRVVRHVGPALHRAGRRGPRRPDRSSRRSTAPAATRRSCAALIEAAEAGKQVVVLVEIKARFDERANIVWARALERAGAHVAYGLVGLKTHSKVALVVRREGRGLRRYVHIGTGNYNPQDGAQLRRPGPADGRPGAGRRRDRPLQPADRALAPEALSQAARRAEHAALGPDRPDQR